MSTLIGRLPKAELHVHIEGCLEPDLVLKLAERNNLQQKLPYKTLAEAEAAFQYDSLQEFPDLRDATLQVNSMLLLCFCVVSSNQPAGQRHSAGAGFADRAKLLRGHNAIFEPSGCAAGSAYRDFL